MNCTISGEVPEEPVVSKKSGHVYERRLIEKAIEQTGRCPATGLELSRDGARRLRAASPRARFSNEPICRLRAAAATCPRRPLTIGACRQTCCRCSRASQSGRARRRWRRSPAC
jgi:hypothetical protein